MKPCSLQTFISHHRPVSVVKTQELETALAPIYAIFMVILAILFFWVMVIVNPKRFWEFFTEDEMGYLVSADHDTGMLEG